MTSSRFPLITNIGLFLLTILVSDLHGMESFFKSDPLPKNAIARIGTTRFRHGDCVTSLAFSADEKFLLSASRDGTVSVWETASGRELQRCHGHKGAVLAAQFTHADRQLLSAGSDGTIRRWKRTDDLKCDHFSRGEEIQCSRLILEEGQAVALSADGTTAAMGTANGAIVVWDLVQNRQRCRFQQEGQVYALALSPDGKHLAANQAASGALLYDTIQEKLIHTFTQGVVTTFAFSPNSKCLAIGLQNNRLLLWDTRKHEIAHDLLPQSDPVQERFDLIQSLCFSPDGRWLALGGQDKAVRVLDCATGRQEQVLRGHLASVTALCFSREGKVLATGGTDNTIRLWEWQTGKSLQAEREPALPLTGVSLVADGKVLVTIESSGRIGLWDTANGTKQPLPDTLTTELFTAASFGPIGQSLALAGLDNRLRFFNPATRRSHLVEGETPRRLEQFVWSRDGSLLASTGPDHHIDVWNSNSNELVLHLGLQEDAYLALAFDHDSGLLAASSESNLIRVWECAKGVELQPMRGRFAGALALAFSADGRSLWSAGSEGQIRLWELATNQIRFSFSIDSRGITAVAFSRDGRFLATGDAKGNVSLWETSTGKAKGDYRGHRGAITMLTFSLGAERLVSASRDTTALVWDSRETREVETSKPSDIPDSQMEILYAQLAGDAVGAYEAMRTLKQSPKKTVAHLRGRMQPVRLDIARWIADLDSDAYSVRQRASEQLARYGRVCENPLRLALKQQPSLEVRRRIEELLAAMREGPDRILVTPRDLRCVELLESINSAESQQLLQVLAGGIAESDLTQQAKESLKRLKRSKKP